MRVEVMNKIRMAAGYRALLQAWPELGACFARFISPIRYRTV